MWEIPRVYIRVILLYAALAWSQHDSRSANSATARKSGSDDPSAFVCNPEGADSYFEFNETGTSRPRVTLIFSRTPLDFGIALLSSRLSRRLLVTNPTPHPLCLCVSVLSARNSSQTSPARTASSLTESGCGQDAELSSRDASGRSAAPIAFHLVSQAFVSLAPDGALQLEVAFEPRSEGQYSADLCVVSAVAGRECVGIRGVGQAAGGLQGGLRAQFSLGDFGERLVAVGDSQVLPPDLTFRRTLRTRNVGPSPVIVRGMLLNGERCSMWGVTLDNCREASYVQPGHFLQVTITYTCSWVDTELSLSLELQTDLGPVSLPLHIGLSPDIDFAVLRDLVGARPSSLLLAEASQVVLVALCVGHFAVLVEEVITTPQTVAVRRKAFRGEAARLGRVRSPVLATEKHCEVPRMRETVERSAGRKRKVKKQRSCIIKFAPAAQRAPATVSSAVIATNKLLARVVKRPQPPDDVESRDSLATAHTEEDTDVFLDDYKARHSLFSGFASVME